MGIQVQEIFNQVEDKANNISGRFEVDDIINYTNDYVKYMRRGANFPWTLKKQSIYVFNDVVEYPVFADLGRFLSPQKPYPNNDDSYLIYTTQPELARNKGLMAKCALDYINGQKFLAIRYSPGNTDLTLADTSVITNWLQGGDAGAPSVDTTYFRLGSSSLAFNVVNALNYATMENNGLLLNLQTQYNKAFVFIYVYMPTVVTSVKLSWGTDINNNYNVTATTQFNGAPFSIGWNLIGVNWYGATVTGVPDYTNITWTQVRLNGAATGTYRINGFQVKLWTEFILPYYSIYNFLASDNVTYKEFATAQDDTLIGDNEYVDLATYWNLKSVATYKVKDSDLKQSATEDFSEALKQFKSEHPELYPKVQTDYFPDDLGGGFGSGINRSRNNGWPW